MGLEKLGQSDVIKAGASLRTMRPYQFLMRPYQLPSYYILLLKVIFYIFLATQCSAALAYQTRY
jgi:hypothetical protein